MLDEEMKRIDIPQEVIKCKAWLIAHRRFEDANTLSRILTSAEDDQKIDGASAHWLKSIFEEFCSEHKILPAYKQHRFEGSFEAEATMSSEELFETLLGMKRDLRKKRGW